MRLATAEREGRRFGAVVEDDVLFPLPDGLAVDDLVRSGLDRALEVGASPAGAGRLRCPSCGCWRR